MAVRINLEDAFADQRKLITALAGRKTINPQILKTEEGFEDFSLKIKNQTVEFGSGKIGDVFDNGVIACPPLVSFARTKKLITTSVNKTDEVVEVWSVPGFEIAIDGILVDSAGHLFPEKQISMLHDLFEINQFAEVSGKIFEALRISTIYLTFFELTPLLGFEDTVRYRMNAKSIRPYKFILKP